MVKVRAWWLKTLGLPWAPIGEEAERGKEEGGWWGKGGPPRGEQVGGGEDCPGGPGGGFTTLERVPSISSMGQSSPVSPLPSRAWIYPGTWASATSEKGFKVKLGLGSRLGWQAGCHGLTTLPIPPLGYSLSPCHDVSSSTTKLLWTLDRYIWCEGI